MVSRLRVGQWFAIATGALLAATVTGVVLGILAVVNLSHARNDIVNRLDPAQTAALRLSNALVNEETGVRGFALTGRPQFLEPYRTGQHEEAAATRQLLTFSRDLDVADITAELAAVRAVAADWRTGYAEPTIADVRVHGRKPAAAVAIDAGKAGFDAVRTRLDNLQAAIVTAREDGRHRLERASRLLTIAFIAIATLLALTGLAVTITLRRIVSRPLSRLSAETRRVARGDFAHVVQTGGPRDIGGLARNVDGMRRRIVRELEAVSEANEQLDRQAADLRRSNAELEQFAYVASHDLQEPLRKVASFTQLLQRRYQGELDARADQYIEFAVDGAKRMQQLINDLLAFSRVGRVPAEMAMLDMRAVLDSALSGLSAVQETGAEIECGPLPAVRGEASLLGAVLQNLVGNALKFRGEATPRIAIGAERDGDDWRFTVADNGIGIAPEYAERIFVIFQRLHAKEAYEGTGIGLALCRKIIEYHGGRIWLDTGVTAGTTFHFTLPVPEETR